MREIKFRGFDDLTGNGWVYGDFSHGYYGNECLVDEIIVDEKTVGQFTGLLDADGREIYEGDIIQSEIAEYLAVVEFRKGAFVAVTGPVESYQALSGVLRLKGLRVIGNVYDNPGLLEADNARD